MPRLQPERRVFAAQVAIAASIISGVGSTGTSFMSGGVARLFHCSASSGLQSSIALTWAFVEAPTTNNQSRPAVVVVIKARFSPQNGQGKSAPNPAVEATASVVASFASCDVCFVVAILARRESLSFSIASMRSSRELITEFAKLSKCAPFTILRSSLISIISLPHIHVCSIIASGTKSAKSSMAFSLSASEYSSTQSSVGCLDSLSGHAFQRVGI